MRLAPSVNDRHIATASLENTGWLGAHINLSRGNPDETNAVMLTAIDTSDEPNTTHHTWAGTPLKVGDSIHIHILPDGPFDPPSISTQTSHSPSNLFSDPEQARAMLVTISSFDKALSEFAQQAATTKPPEELRKIHRAIGSVIAELDQQLITPTLRRHPELLVEAQELQIR